ncbi:hypothetical protein [Brevibacillus brevis]|uniref:DUF4083 domain-containing protein n=1 Tax=Brevibacillus brevis TaxID=1393 RepID=A0ABY9TCW8_BREBE|nr:hypothetical protein [Brevibacillus brevis]WNC16782.1 hypothetical protein RGB73_10820 [Brevibacillus brevis]
MLDFGAVSIEWGTLLFQLFSFILFPIVLLLGFLKILSSRFHLRRQTIRELEDRVKAFEKRIATLEKERDDKA